MNLISHLGNIRDILGTAMKNKNEFRKRQSAINSYMVKYKVPKVVQERVKLWMEFSWEQQKNCDENKMLAFLPGKMRTDLALRVRFPFQKLENLKIKRKMNLGSFFYFVKSKIVSRL